MEPGIESSSLTIPNDLAYLPAIQAFLSEVMGRCGYNERDTTMVLIALEEAIVNVVKHAFEPGEKASYQVIVDPITAGIRIIVKDKGLPYSPSLVPSYVPPSDIDATPQPGLGSHLIKNSVDEIFFHNLGREGKELHLIKHLPYRSIQEIRAEAELAPFPEPIKMAGPPEKKEFSIRPIRPSEVYDVSKLFYRAYGYSYGIDTIYYPEKLAQCHADGIIISVVTVTPDDRVVGHAALVRDNPSSKTAEAAMAVVEPGFRGQGCQSVMITKLVEEARSAGLAGIYSKAVTNHIYAQKAGQKAGFKRCAVVAGLIPADRSFKGIQAALSQRESVAYGYRVVNDPGDIELFPPARHREMIERIYASADVKRIFPELPRGSVPEPEEEAAEITVTVVPTYQRAVIEVQRFGRNTLSQVNGILKGLCYEKMEQITLYLNLQDPLTSTMCSGFEDMGFFFAGILPFSHVGDALLLQYLNNVPIDYDKIKIVDAVGQEILAYVESHDPSKL
ncbi:MAG: GNAT family N-acetyltransferase [Syntrophorhabdaceae bacterium]|nr:GNAT family N-acetyltransferase [Syntrophorhabdaceae bacterium]